MEPAVADFIHPENFLRAIKEEMNEAMQRAAEPIIVEALKKVERAMRERMAVMLVSKIEAMYDMQRIGPDLRITVKGAFGDKA